MNSEEKNNPKKTPLYDCHESLGAKITDFAGWLMPLQYTGALDEHNNVRTKAGLFDTSHMGELLITGDGALDAVQALITNDLNKIDDGRCQYNIVCNEEGNALDDVIVYRYSTDKIFICVNAGNKDKIYKWFSSKIGDKVKVEDLSDSYAMLALQGPKSPDIMKELAGEEVSSMKPFRFKDAEVLGAKCIIATTGYTGEKGFEIFVSLKGSEEKGGGDKVAVDIWNELLLKGAPYGLQPTGLVARDTLRLEMGYPLYGNELNESTSPIEAGLKKYVSLTKEDFIGKKNLEKQAVNGTKKLLRGFVMDSRQIGRSHYKVFDGDNEIGEVTSGTFSPSLKKSIGLAFLNISNNQLATGEKSITIEVRGKKAGAKTCDPPFYKK